MRKKEVVQEVHLGKIALIDGQIQESAQRLSLLFRGLLQGSFEQAQETHWLAKRDVKVFEDMLIQLKEHLSPQSVNQAIRKSIERSLVVFRKRIKVIDEDLLKIIHYERGVMTGVHHEDTLLFMRGISLEQQIKDLIAHASEKEALKEYQSILEQVQIWETSKERLLSVIASCEHILTHLKTHTLYHLSKVFLKEAQTQVENLSFFTLESLKESFGMKKITLQKLGFFTWRRKEHKKAAHRHVLPHKEKKKISTLSKKEHITQFGQSMQNLLGQLQDHKRENGSFYVYNLSQGKEVYERNKLDPYTVGPLFSPVLGMLLGHHHDKSVLKAMPQMKASMSTTLQQAVPIKKQKGMQKLLQAFSSYEDTNVPAIVNNLLQHKKTPEVTAGVTYITHNHEAVSCAYDLGIFMKHMWKNKQGKNSVQQTNHNEQLLHLLQIEKGSFLTNHSVFDAHAVWSKAIAHKGLVGEMAIIHFTNVPTQPAFLSVGILEKEHGGFLWRSKAKNILEQAGGLLHEYVSAVHK